MLPFFLAQGIPLGALAYQGAWNASTNSPALASGVGTRGYYYVVSVAGTTTLDGTSVWDVGDWAVFNGTTWDKVEGGSSSTFTSVKINANATALPTALTGTLLQIAQADGVSPRIELDPYGAAGFLTVVRRSGTAAAPTQVLASQQISGFNGDALDNAATIRGPIASFRIYALDNITSTTMGSIASIATIATGGTTLTDFLTVYGLTGVGIGLASATTVPAAKLEVAGDLTLTGAMSAASWTTGGLRFRIPGAILTNTTSSGTVAAQYASLFGAPTFAFSSATTITNAYNLYISDPVAGTNATLTSKWALGADSASLGGTQIATTGVITTSAGGNSTQQLIFTPNSGSTTSFGNLNGGSGLLWFQGGTKAGLLASNAVQLRSDGAIKYGNSTDPGSTMDTGISRDSAGVIAIGTGTAGSAAGSLKATAGTFTGAVAIGNTLNSVSPTSPNRTVTMVVGGVTVYIAAKTTND